MISLLVHLIAWLNEALDHYRLIYYSTEPSALIILEDVRGLGFGVIERTPEDLEVSKRIFRRLAKFHAASFYLHDEQVKFSYKIFISDS